MPKLFQLSLMVLIAVALPLAAQRKDSRENTNTRSVQGAVLDAADNPIVGAVVQLKDTRTLQITSFITREKGTYHFHNLSRDVDYELKARHNGKTSDDRRLSSFDSRRDAVINLKIE